MLARRWFSLIVVTFLVLVIYANIYNVPIIFDGAHHIKENALVKDVLEALSCEAISKARSVVVLTFALNHYVGGFNVFGYHVVNVLIHIANGILVYFLSLALLSHLPFSDGKPQGIYSDTMREVKGKRRRRKEEQREGRAKTDRGFNVVPFMALFAALVFVAHPIQTQAVTYIVQRYTSMAAFFYMASVLAYVKARESTRSGTTADVMSVGLYVLSFICGILSFKSKEIAASLPGAIVLVEYLCFGGTWREWVRKLLRLVPFLVLFEVYVLYSRGFFSSADVSLVLEDISAMARETESVGRWQYLCTQFSVLVIYLRLLVCPVNQNLDYMYRFKNGFFDGYTPVAVAFLIALVVFAVWKRRKYPVVTFAVFWFFITLSVESSIIPIRDALFEHRLYLPMFGFSLFVSWLVIRVFSRKRAVALAVCVVIIASLGTATFLRNRVWRDPVTLWSDVLKKAPHNSRAYFSLGAQYEKKGYPDTAFRYYTKAIALAPRYGTAHYNLGNLLSSRGDLQQAVHHYSEAIRVQPKNIKARVNLAAVKFRQGDIEAALRELQAALDYEPHNETILLNIGRLYEENGQQGKAVYYYTEVIQNNPHCVDAHYKLGNIFLKEGDWAAAIRHYNTVLTIDPKNVTVLNNLGCAREMTHDVEGAIACYRRALAINPGHVEAAANLERVMQKKAVK